jgi:hypothetical protein
VHGQGLAGGQVWTDQAALRSLTYANLTSYWTPVAAQLRAAPPEAIGADEVAWCVLGVSRLHYLLATGSMTSKSRAGRHAREHPGQPSAYGADLVARGRDTAAFTTMAIESGLACGP